MNVQRHERKHLLCRGEIYNHRDVSALSGKHYKVFREQSRRLTKGEENALAIIGLRMASEKRIWVAGEPHEVSVGSVMSKVFDNPRLMARTVFQSWFKRIGIKLVKHSTATRGVWVTVPRTLEGHESAFGDTGGGTCWQILVKPEVLYEALKLHIDNMWIRNQKNTTPEEATVNREVDVSGRSQTNAASPGLPIIPPEYDPDAGRPHASALADLESTIEELVEAEKPAHPAGMPFKKLSEYKQEGAVGNFTAQELYDANKEYLEYVDRVRNEAREAAEMAVNPPWIGPSDPATVVEDLNKIDRLLDEAEQMSQVGYGEHDEESELEEAQISVPEAQVAVPGAQEVRRIDVPPEVRGWEDDD